MNRVYVFWSWNGRIDREGILRSLEQFRQAGIGGFFMHARAGLEVPYFSDEWHELVRFAAIEGYRRGLDAWLYDEDGWPSGFAGGRVPEQARSYWQSWLEERRLTGAELTAEEEVAAIFDAQNQLISPRDVLQDREYTAFVIRRNSLYTDLMNPEAVRCFLRETHEVYRQKLGDLFGKEIKGIFTDEPQLANFGFPYTERLFEEFERAYGYSLKEKLYLLTGDGGEKLRFDYRMLLTRLYHDSFAGQIGDWCKKHNLIFTGHMAAEDGLDCQIQTQGDVMPGYPHYGMPGIDFLMTRRRAPLTLIKQPVSVARQTGKPHVLSETFGGSGHAASFGDLLKLWFYQAMFGVDVACMHLSAYSILGRRKRDYPPTFSYHMNCFPQLKTFTGAVAKIAEAASERERAEILVLNPIASFFAGYRGRYRNRKEQAEFFRLSEITTHYRILQENLAALHYAYELGDELLMQTLADVRGGELTVGECRYRAVIVPDCDCVLSSTAALLERFADCGGRVIFINRLPELVDGLPSDRFKAMFLSDKACVLCNRRALFGRQLAACGLAPAVTVTSDGSQTAESVYATVCGSQVMLLNLAEEERLLHVACHGREYAVAFSAGEGVILDWEQGLVRRPFCGGEEKLIPCNMRRSELPVRWSVQMGDNTAVLDRCRARVNGRDAGEGLALEVNEEVFALLSAEGLQDALTEVCYSFESDIEGELRLSVEQSPDLRGVSCNGCKASPEEGWFVDRGIANYRIHVRRGENTVTLTYTLSCEKALSEGFENEKNRYFRRTELENVYLSGAFSIAADCTERRNAAGRYALFDSFRLCAQGDASDPFSRPFFRGTLVYSTRFSCEQQGRTLLSLPGSFPLVSVALNGVDCGNALGGYPLDVSAAVRRGENELTVTCYTSDRNLLGPHHYCNFDCELVGPETYAGIRNWEAAFDQKTPFNLLPERTAIHAYCSKLETLAGRIVLTSSVPDERP